LTNAPDYPRRCRERRFGRPEAFEEFGVRNIRTTSLARTASIGSARLARAGRSPAGRS